MANQDTSISNYKYLMILLYCDNTNNGTWRSILIFDKFNINELYQNLPSASGGSAYMYYPFSCGDSLNNQLQIGLRHTKVAHGIYLMVNTKATNQRTFYAKLYGLS